MHYSIQSLVFLTNQVNHHQIHVADEFYKEFGDNYKYIATEPVNTDFVASGYPELDRPYIIRTYKQEFDTLTIQMMINDADIVIIGAAPDSYVSERLNNNKITFHYSERWFKCISYHLLSPRLWIHIYKNHFKYRNKQSYMLCASAFTAKDVNNVLCYKNKCFKWGYFTKVEEIDIDSIIQAKDQNVIRIMWCARFLKLKHPELPIKLAEILKKKSYNVQIDMFGNGPELERTKLLAAQKDVTDIVNFMGNMPNEELLKTYRRYHIFIFTSDRNEGWGAVLNEAMSNGCAVVASDEIGSAPFLIRDGVNGFLFKSKSIKSLAEKVEKLLLNPQLITATSRNAYLTMSKIWSPQNAARNFIKLIDAIKNDSLERFTQTITDGPCSRTE